MNYAADTFLNQDHSYAEGLLGLTASQMVLVCMYIILDEGLYFTKESKEAIFYFIQKLYFKPTEGIVMI